MTFCRFIKRRGNDLCIDCTRHVRNLLGTLVNQEHHQVCFRMVGGNGIGNILHQDGLSCLRLCNDQGTLSFADR